MRWLSLSKILLLAATENAGYISDRKLCACCSLIIKTSCKNVCCHKCMLFSCAKLEYDDSVKSEDERFDVELDIFHCLRMN